MTRTATRARMPFTVEHTARNAVTVRIKVKTTIDWEQWFLLSSDRHHDNAHCDQDMERRHLDQARERNAGVIDYGDLFCAMQGKWDKRADRGAMREEYQYGPYLDTLVSEAADFYGPYADNFVVIGRGNHETAIYKRHETDLTERLVAVLNDRNGSQIQAGGYAGWVRFAFERGKTQRQSVSLHYYHGSGGGGPVTKDMIGANRLQVAAEADIYCFGHTHDAWHNTIHRIRLDHNGKPVQRQADVVKTPSYKDEYGDGMGGWSVERRMPPKPLGAYWLRFYWDGSRGLQRQFIRAD